MLMPCVKRDHGEYAIMQYVSQLNPAVNSNYRDWCAVTARLRRGISTRHAVSGKLGIGCSVPSTHEPAAAERSGQLA